MVEIPYYWQSIDWDALMKAYPPPPVYAETTRQRSADELRALQEARFRERMKEAWTTPFYRERWTSAGLDERDVRGLDDLPKIPTFGIEDLHASFAAHPPFGGHHNIGRDNFCSRPTKISISDGATPRIVLLDSLTWEIRGIQAGRALFAQGARPGDILQITQTNGLATAPWSAFAAALHWVACVPLTTGGDEVTPGKRQIELARSWGTKGWYGFAGYLEQLPEVAREIGFDIRELNTEFIHSYVGIDEGRVRRRRMEEAWGAPVYDNYGSLETGNVAFECPQKDGMHVQEDMSFVEVLDVDSGTPLADGEKGHLVVTNLWESSIPVIRFNLRDRMRRTASHMCGCGIHSAKISGMLEA